MSDKITKKELLEAIQTEVSLSFQNESVNPWAVCHASTGPKKTDKFEKCVMSVKKKEGIDEEHNSGAAIRNKGEVIFSSGSSKVGDDKDHFPINNINQARNALARASQYDSVPSWYNGSLKELVVSVHNKVHSKYPEIKTTEKSLKPGKG